MNHNPTIPYDPAQDVVAHDGTVDLEKLLHAWNTATERLQNTHRMLRDQVGRLTDELERKNRELARNNRLADLGRMASHIAHEVRNGLMPVTLYLSLLRRRMLHDEEGVMILDNIESGATALESTVQDLLHFTSDREPKRDSVSLEGLLEEVLVSIQPQLEAQAIRIWTDITPDLMASVDANMIRRALLNLVLNAVDAMPVGGELDITACETSQGIEIEVADSGPGLPNVKSDELFQPFFTTKSEGTGLGLSIVYRIAEVHGGAVFAMNCHEGGAAFTMRLPTTIAAEPMQPVYKEKVA